MTPELTVREDFKKLIPPLQPNELTQLEDNILRDVRLMEYPTYRVYLPGVAGKWRMVRDGDWKLVLGNGSGGRQQPRGKPFEKPYQLFDLSSDIGEETDVAAHILAAHIRDLLNGQNA